VDNLSSITKDDKITVLVDKISEADNYINDLTQAIADGKVSDDQMPHITIVIDDQRRILQALRVILEDVQATQDNQGEQ
jgi:hypothetical protein